MGRAQWLWCASQLGQWDAPVEFGKSVDNYEMLLDSLWKLPDWTYEGAMPQMKITSSCRGYNEQKLWHGCFLSEAGSKVPSCASKEQEETSQVLTQVLQVVNNADEANNEAWKKSFQVVDFLVQELFNQNASVNVQSCLALLASRIDSKVSELLEQLYHPILQPLIVRQLKLKTVDQQWRSQAPARLGTCPSSSTSRHQNLPIATVEL